MTAKEQQERVRAMLKRYRDALSASSSIPTGENGDRLLMFPPEFNQALRELDRCLSRMQQLGYQQAIAGVPLRTVRWHVIGFYVDVDYVQVPVYTRKLTRRPGKGSKTEWTRSVTGYTLEPRRHKDAREHRAELGVRWICREYRWDKVHFKAIQDACGEIHERVAA